MTVHLNINGQAISCQIPAHMTLLDLLREELGLVGTNKGCDHGQCGACTVLIDGQRALSCLKLAAMVDAPVLTIEGLSPPGHELHPMQEAFLKHDAFQCGYCTPGQIMSALGCIEEGLAQTPEQVREVMAGNLCRCSAYPHILRAILDGKARMERLKEQK